MGLFQKTSEMDLCWWAVWLFQCFLLDLKLSLLLVKMTILTFEKFLDQMWYPDQYLFDGMLKNQTSGWCFEEAMKDQMKRKWSQEGWEELLWEWK